MIDMSNKWTEEMAREHDEKVDRIVERTGFEWNHACCFMYSAIDEVVCMGCGKRQLCEEALSVEKECWNGQKNS